VRRHATFWFLLLVVVWPVAGKSSSFPAGAKSRNIVLPLYPSGHLEPGAVVHIGAIFTEHERRGFFRIGLLPVLVFDGVDFEIRDEDRFAASFKDIQPWLQSRAKGRAVELRGVRFFSPINSASLAEFGRIRFGARGEWEISQLVLANNGAEIRAQKGTLHLAGPQAGLLVCESEGMRRQFRLFPATSTLISKENDP
jgi:hypothetical protein